MYRRRLNDDPVPRRKVTDQAVVDEVVGNAHGNLARVQELVEAHPDLVNAKATWNETPIEAATQMGNRAIIDFLVEQIPRLEQQWEARRQALVASGDLPEERPGQRRHR